MRAMAKRPEDRFASAADFATAMKEVLGGATELSPGLALLAPKATAPSAEAEPRPIEPPVHPSAGSGVSSTPLPALASTAIRKQSLGLLFGVGLAFLFVGAALAFLAMRMAR